MLSSQTKVAGSPCSFASVTSSDKVVSSLSEDERKSFSTCLFLTTCARKLDLSSITWCTSCWLFHKFSSAVGSEDYDEYMAAMASIFLACKIDDSPIKIRDVINVAYRTLHPDRPFLEINETYSQLVDSLIQFELFLCRILRFQLSYDNPHKYLLHYLRSLCDWLYPRQETQTFCKMAWALLHDCHYSKMCVTSRPDHLALTVCYIALEALQMKVPLEEHCEKSWWKVFVDDIQLSDITLLADQMLLLIENERFIK
ncbi:cyclin-Q-like isoform X2 [Watersipora subatra]|uniref:cyclin-Q-like isoform X2 n=1 Tax=Watersipora subatra TaxID=2589382 RepID=UPI00355C5D69